MITDGRACLSLGLTCHQSTLPGPWVTPLGYYQWDPWIHINP